MHNASTYDLHQRILLDGYITAKERFIFFILEFWIIMKYNPHQEPGIEPGWDWRLLVHDITHRNIRTAMQLYKDGVTH